MEMVKNVFFIFRKATFAKLRLTNSTLCKYVNSNIILICLFTQYRIYNTALVLASTLHARVEVISMLRVVHKYDPPSRTNEKTLSFQRFYFENTCCKRITLYKSRRID